MNEDDVTPTTLILSMVSVSVIAMLGGTRGGSEAMLCGLLEARPGSEEEEVKKKNKKIAMLSCSMNKPIFVCMTAMLSCSMNNPVFVCITRTF
jgi:hypothetical protein